MSDKKIALVACSNGYGHVRRMLILSIALDRMGVQSVIFAPKESVENLCKIFKIPTKINVVDFRHGGEHKEWNIKFGTKNNFPLLDNYDLIICDNLVSILIPYPNAWLSGSFFWHRSMQNFPKDRVSFLDKLLKRLKPKMITTALFIPDYLAEDTNLIKVGLYVYGENKEKKISNRDILISCGCGGDVEKETKTLIEWISRGKKHMNLQVWVEPKMYEKSMPAWILPATYSHDMYSKLGAAIIRPGVGTITDALFYSTRLFMFHELGNSEMKNNAAAIEKAGLGEISQTPLEAWNMALEYLTNSEAQETQFRLVSDLNFNGGNEAAKIIAKALL